jgi:hypothetical protein
VRNTRPRTRMQVSHPLFDSKVRLDCGCRGIRLDIMRDVPRHPVFLHKGTRPEDTDVEMKVDLQVLHYLQEVRLSTRRTLGRPLARKDPRLLDCWFYTSFLFIYSQHPSFQSSAVIPIRSQNLKSERGKIPIPVDQNHRREYTHRVPIRPSKLRHSNTDLVVRWSQQCHWPELQNSPLAPRRSSILLHPSHSWPTESLTNA